MDENLKSKCCNAPVILRGLDPKDPKRMCTCWHECTCCGMPCNVKKYNNVEDKKDNGGRRCDN